MQNYNWSDWYFWEDYPMKVTFDGPNKLILINQDEIDINYQIDIYSNWKEWVRHLENSKFLPATSVIGGDPTTGAQRLGRTFFLENGWRIKPYPGSYELTIDGNIFTREGEKITISADISPLFPNNIEITRTVSNLIDLVVVEPTATTGSGLTDEQTAQISDIQTKSDELWKIHGLDTGSILIVTPTTRQASGSISQTIVQDVTGSTTVTRI